MSIFQVEGEDARIVEFVNATAAPFLRQLTHFFYVSQEEDDYTYQELMDMYFVELVGRWYY